jgi:hypothetical protein
MRQLFEGVRDVLACLLLGFGRGKLQLHRLIFS